MPMTIDALDLPRSRRLTPAQQTSMSPCGLGWARWARSAAAVALLVSFAAPVGAAEPAAPASAPQPSSAAPPSAAQKETARTWLREGYEALERGQPAAALERFSGAYQLVRVPTTGLAVAQAQERLGQWVEANATAMEVLNMPRQPDEPEVFGRARDDARALSDRLSQLIPSLRVEVTPDGADARVAIDGVEMQGAANGMPLRLNPGEHQLRVSAPGYVPAERALALRESSHEQLSIELASDPYAAVAETPSAAAPDAADATPGSAARTRGYVGLGVAIAARPIKKTRRTPPGSTATSRP